jgi:hypothetical protein
VEEELRQRHATLEMEAAEAAEEHARVRAGLEEQVAHFTTEAPIPCTSICRVCVCVCIGGNSRPGVSIPYPGHRGIHR